MPRWWSPRLFAYSLLFLCCFVRLHSREMELHKLSRGVYSSVIAGIDTIGLLYCKEGSARHELKRVIHDSAYASIFPCSVGLS